MHYRKWRFLIFLEQAIWIWIRACGREGLCFDPSSTAKRRFPIFSEQAIPFKKGRVRCGREFVDERDLDERDLNEVFLYREVVNEKHSLITIFKVYSI